MDSVKITYNTSSGSQTVTHGGPGGKEGLNFNLTGKFVCLVFKNCSPGITANQTITAVYGRRLNSSTAYGSRKCVACGLDIVDTVSFKTKVVSSSSIVQLSFVVATTDSDASGNPPAVSVQSIILCCLHCRFITGSRQLFLQAT